MVSYLDDPYSRMVGSTLPSARSEHYAGILWTTIHASFPEFVREHIHSHSISPFLSTPFFAGSGINYTRIISRGSLGQLISSPRFSHVMALSPAPFKLVDPGLRGPAVSGVEPVTSWLGPWMSSEAQEPRGVRGRRLRE